MEDLLPARREGAWACMWTAVRERRSVHACKRDESILNSGCAGHQVIVVTSGAVGVGCHRLGLTSKPTQLAQKQALAAVGQIHLMKYYEDIFNAVGLVRA